MALGQSMKQYATNGASVLFLTLTSINFQSLIENLGSYLSDNRQGANGLRNVSNEAQST